MGADQVVTTGHHPDQRELRGAVPGRLHPHAHHRRGRHRPEPEPPWRPA
ncbi:hypothetical protein QJS66_06925 [Kocuria rhizophila]|nr:hypothetical protein QJS66_06925 [Kocuria rhizophila]